MSLRSEPELAPTEQSFGHRWVTPISVSAMVVVLTTAVLWRIEAHLRHEHLIFIYLVPTALIAIRYGSISAMCVAIASSLAATYFLYPPVFTFELDPLQVMELLLFSMLALLASQVVSGFANDRVVARRRLQQRPAQTPRRAAFWKLLGL